MFVAAIRINSKPNRVIETINALPEEGKIFMTLQVALRCACILWPGQEADKNVMSVEMR